MPGSGVVHSISVRNFAVPRGRRFQVVDLLEQHGLLHVPRWNTGLPPLEPALISCTPVSPTPRGYA